MNYQDDSEDKQQETVHKGRKHKCKHCVYRAVSQSELAQFMKW